ncbi:hypothetical protein Tco_1511600, partial [Tanacetum coccineum]
CVGIKSLLEVTAAQDNNFGTEGVVNTACTQLMLVVQKLLLFVLKVNTAGIKVTTAGRVYADREEIKDLSEKE